VKTIEEQISHLSEPISLSELNMHLSLEETENDYWGEPTFLSGLVIGCHKLRTLSLSQLTVEHLRMAIGQRMSLPYLIPLAVEKLTINPLAEGHCYEGDLLQNVLKVDNEYFEWDKNSASCLVSICKQAASKIRAKNHAYGDDELLVLIDEFVKKYE